MVLSRWHRAWRSVPGLCWVLLLTYIVYTILIVEVVA
jgi:hypothetical protein